MYFNVFHFRGPESLQTDYVHHQNQCISMYFIFEVQKVFRQMTNVHVNRHEAETENEGLGDMQKIFHFCEITSNIRLEGVGN